MIKLLYGTSNSAKLNSMKEILYGLDIEITSLIDIRIENLKPVKEVGSSPLENARIKAMSYYKDLKVPVFSCDTGLYIKGLESERQPGVYVRRVNGKELSDEEMIEYYTKVSSELGGYARAKYKNAICLIMDEDNIFEYDGKYIESEEFIIATKPHPSRVKGFPLNSLSVEIESGLYYMDLKEKNNCTNKNKVAKGFRNFFIRSIAKYTDNLDK